MRVPEVFIPQPLKLLSRYATLRRAVGLLRDFKFEQSDPDRFYSHLAQDTVEVISRLWEGVTGRTLEGTRIVDVGGGPGYFGRAFDTQGASYISVEPDVGEMAAAGIRLASSVRGSGLDLPLRDNCADVCYSSNVAEHVPSPWRMAREMVRITRPGGVIIYSYTVWLGPFGGHETGLWQHYVGGEFARRRYRRKFGHEPKNKWGESLFDVSCGEGLAWAKQAVASGAVELVGAFPRYHPWWAWWMVKVPVLREFAVSNLVLVLRKN